MTVEDARPTGVRFVIRCRRRTRGPHPDHGGRAPDRLVRGQGPARRRAPHDHGRRRAGGARPRAERRPRPRGPDIGTAEHGRPGGPRPAPRAGFAGAGHRADRAGPGRRHGERTRGWCRRLRAQNRSGSPSCSPGCAAACGRPGRSGRPARRSGVRRRPPDLRTRRPGSGSARDLLGAGVRPSPRCSWSTPGRCSARAAARPRGGWTSTPVERRRRLRRPPAPQARCRLDRDGGGMGYRFNR